MIHDFWRLRGVLGVEAVYVKWGGAGMKGDWGCFLGVGACWGC